MPTNEIEHKIDQIAADVAFLKGQFSVISPQDIVNLKAKVHRVEERVYGISAVVGAIVSGITAWFVRGGNS